MGRSKGIVEVRLEPSDVAELSTQICTNMPEKVQGACSVNSTKLFDGFASNSILTYKAESICSSHVTLETGWFHVLVSVSSHVQKVDLGKTMSKDTTIAEYSWALQPLASFVPSQPIHQDSLHAIVQKVVPTAAEGMVWLAVYDLKTLMQCLVSIVQFLHLPGNDFSPQNWSHIFYFVLLLYISSCIRFQHLRFTRKVWRKARQGKTEDGWPAWVREQPVVQLLFDTMQPFVDEDSQDVAKAWTIDEACRWMPCNCQLLLLSLAGLNLN